MRILNIATHRVKKDLFLAIESSCDDSCVSIIDKKLNVIYSKKISQKQIHQPFGGVVPQLAAQAHRESFNQIFSDKTFKSVIKNNCFKFIAFTAGPGIANCLNSGFEAAKSLTRSTSADLLPVHHLVGHILSVKFNNELKFPVLSFITSGGNTKLVLSRSTCVHHIMGETIDDSIGEAIDKIARSINCEWADEGGYGRGLELLARSGSPLDCFRATSLLNYRDPLSFSFSGIKTAFKTFISEKSNNKFSKQDLAATAQKVLFDHLISRLENCFDVLKASGLRTTQLCLIGGVASNMILRKRVEFSCIKNDTQICVPELKYCTDNAEMIALAATKMGGEQSIPRITRIDPNWSLEELCINKYNLD